ncbi:hypothetical protein Metbo_1757 [Methanobacterium lacus]|uniref:Uncharacterized protein n=1 Tax=Methanobacterium lacus (strain AL-21) TaxID=877455 RepID=F0T9V1_METLA|nr:hypothetical protein [Methanobacterium lacus]ADZ09980.1 hypothetical protein Metbo_1757 [Methanobacterium lacus]
MNKLILISLCTILMFLSPVFAADSGSGTNIQGFGNNTDIYGTINNWFSTIQGDVNGFIDTENLQAKFGNYVNTSNIESTVNSNLQNMDIQAYLNDLMNNTDVQSFINNLNIQSITNNPDIQSFLNSLKINTGQN